MAEKTEKTKKIWMDGKLLAWDDAKVHILTHTLQYGLGIFEGIRCYETPRGPAVFRLKEHVRRLIKGAGIFLIESPYSEAEIREAVKKTVKANGLKECYIRPFLYIGHGSMGLYPRGNPICLSIALWPWGTYLGEEGLKKGIRVKTSSFIKPHVNSTMARAKVSGYYVNSQLAKREAVSLGFDEALILDAEGYVAEGPGENIFILRDGVLKTTPLTSILEGITRQSIMTIAKDAGIAVKEERFTRDEVYISDEAFYTGTAAEVTPIRELDGRAIGEGRPGPVTKKLQTAFFNIVKGKNRKYARWLTYI